VRDVAGLTLVDASARCGIDQPALSRLENGHTPNRTLDTLGRYTAALGKRLVLTAEKRERCRRLSSPRLSCWKSNHEKRADDR
jgi:transcriptional regulator with XRE-family HTH domain